MLGLCWRRQKCSAVTALFVLAACAACAVVVLLLSRLHECTAELRAQTQRCRQQQEALTAQLQVVYEHRSRLERSLQKERGEHKKTKEDFLVYKLEAQEALNKEKDAMNRYSALSSQNSILKNQHADLRSQLQSLQTENGELHLAQRRALEECQHQGVLQRTESQDHIASLQDTVMKLREESKLMRKSHQEVHSQLLSAQAQLEEFRQLRQALQKVPGLREHSLIQQQPDTEKHTDSKMLDLKSSIGPLIARPPVGLGLGNTTQPRHQEQTGIGKEPQTVVTHPPISKSKQKTQQEVLDDGLARFRSANQKDPVVITVEKRAGEEGQDQGLDSWNSIIKKNNYNQRQDPNSLSTNQRPPFNHWRDAETNDMKTERPEEINEDKELEDIQDDGELEIDTLGEEVPQGQGIIAQEPMEIGRMGETEDQLEEEDEEEEEGGNEEEY
ncbi:Golgi integral membrane protein 4-like isoform X2 [Megalops cyprinoides]|uniref:Golgi integral membrane protein 4-like isoform X2 n=1 Tax=Megalops cyprinoides TaxID=118141 RepID=UPI001864CA2A|nr:Golgi integral membrane protein 4-like isoform X2 [Megalops cyprinoides]